MSNQSDDKFIKRTFEYDSDLLDELKLMSTLEKKTQKELINGFLEDGLKEWRKSKGQSTLD